MICLLAKPTQADEQNKEGVTLGDSLGETHNRQHGRQGEMGARPQRPSRTEDRRPTNAQKSCGERGFEV